MTRALALTLVAAALLPVGCGGGGGSGAQDQTPASGPARSVPAGANAHAGREVFDDAGCGNCHALSAADAHGQVGPDLDDADVDYTDVVDQVGDGGGGMPSFRDRLSAQEIQNVAAFVIRSISER